MSAIVRPRLFDERMSTRMGWLAVLFVASCMGTYVSARGAFASREVLRWMLDAGSARQVTVRSRKRSINGRDAHRQG